MVILHLGIFLPFIRLLVKKRQERIAIYLPPGKVYFLNPRSTMIFLAEELRDEAK